eukprot:c20535_g1_i1 orf=492-1334(-)
MLARCSRKVLHRYTCTPYLPYLQASRFSSSSPALQEAAPAQQDAVTDNSSQGFAKLLTSLKPRPLDLPANTKLRYVEPEFGGLARLGLRLMGYYHRKSKLLRGARTLHVRIALHADNPALYTTFNLEKSFRTTHAMLVLHMWLLLVRIKAEKPDGSEFSQSLYILYNEDLEKRVVAAGVKMLFSKTMTELEKIFYGSVQAYDKAMMPEAAKDDLARALWRNVFAEDDSMMPTGELAVPVQCLAQYVRRETACLAMTDTESILSGNILFSTDRLWQRVHAS